MNGVIYKTTNLINGKIYIGKSEKNNPSYLGSGKLVRLAVKKHGKENFVKDVVDYGENRKDLCLKEIGWIKHFRELCIEMYNIALGGEGVGSGENHPNFGKHPSEETLAKMSNAQSGEKHHMYGKKKPHSEETKEKIGKTRIEKGWARGENNPMFGRKGELSPNFGRKRPDVSERLKLLSGQDNPNSRTNREKRRLQVLTESEGRV